MTPEEQKQFIIATIKLRLDDFKSLWAKNYMALKYNEPLGTDSSKKEVEAAKLNMKVAEEQITFFNNLLIEESK